MQLPYVPDQVFEILHEFSVFLLKDDKHDLGYYRYYRRKGHYYLGHPAPNHPGMLHHWQVGMAGLVMAQIGGLINLARDAMVNSHIAENIDESQLYDESTVIDLDESAVSEVVPEPDYEIHSEEVSQQSIVEQQEQQMPELPSVEESRIQPLVQLTTIPSLSEIAKL